MVVSGTDLTPRSVVFRTDGRLLSRASLDQLTICSSGYPVRHEQPRPKRHCGGATDAPPARGYDHRKEVEISHRPEAQEGEGGSVKDVPE